MSTRKTTLRLPAELDDWLEAEASARGMEKAELIRLGLVALGAPSTPLKRGRVPKGVERPAEDVVR